ncbi:hypothetical protein SDC9_161173 [bioreactor metagenome]|uniref:Uncharacterized protein n=1 Tax=bioreactor metagenome TaxID=1076179 RepID=A0A645FHM2_9ZZZZ
MHQDPFSLLGAQHLRELKCTPALSGNAFASPSYSAREYLSSQIGEILQDQHNHQNDLTDQADDVGPLNGMVHEHGNGADDGNGGVS